MDHGYNLGNVLPEVQAAWAERDLKKLLGLWYTLITPIKSEDFMPIHNDWSNGLFLMVSLDTLAAERLSPEEFQSSYARWRVFEAGYELRDMAAAKQAKTPA